MKHRVRGAALMVEDDRILLVKHVHPDTGEEWWIPPGGGVEDADNSLYDCVQREVFEETGLAVTLERIVYVREFVDLPTDTFHFELILNSSGSSGELTIENIKGTGEDELYIKEARWVRRDEMQELVVYPEMLKDEFWDDLAAGFPQTRYLGRSSG